MTPCATPPSGAWSAWTMSHPTHSLLEGDLPVSEGRVFFRFHWKRDGDAEALPWPFLSLIFSSHRRSNTGDAFLFSVEPRRLTLKTKTKEITQTQKQT